jgi:4-aminobutyrate aminotransferase and related aminotransferases
VAKRLIVSKRNDRKERLQKAPTIMTPPPGPQARAWVRRDERVLSQSATRIYPLVVQKARGVVVEDVDGNRYLDFTAGIAVVATGHSHPKVLRAIRNQVARFVHMSGTDFYYPSQIKLAETIAKIAPVHRPARTFFSNSGAEAVEAAFKLARYHTRRPLMIAFQGAFHGRTMGALSLTAARRCSGDILPHWFPGSRTSRTRIVTAVPMAARIHPVKWSAWTRSGMCTLRAPCLRTTWQRSLSNRFKAKAA